MIVYIDASGPVRDFRFFSKFFFVVVVVVGLVSRDRDCWSFGRLRRAGPGPQSENTTHTHTHTQRLIPHHNTPARLPTTTPHRRERYYIFSSLALPFRSFVRSFFFVCVF